MEWKNNISEGVKRNVLFYEIFLKVIDAITLIPFHYFVNSKIYTLFIIDRIFQEVSHALLLYRFIYYFTATDYIENYLNMKNKMLNISLRRLLWLYICKMILFFSIYLPHYLLIMGILCCRHFLH